jgi:hypothetical protein
MKRILTVTRKITGNNNDLYLISLNIKGLNSPIKDIDYQNGYVNRIQLFAE